MGKGIRLVDLARSAGYDKDFTSSVEMGRVHPSSVALDNFLQVLGTTAEELTSIPQEQINGWIEQGNLARKKPRENIVFQEDRDRKNLEKARNYRRLVEELLLRTERIEQKLDQVILGSQKTNLAPDEKLPPPSKTESETVLFTSETSEGENDVKEVHNDVHIENLKRVGEILFKRRNEIGIKTTILARKSGVGRTMIWVIERGFNPSTGKPSRLSKDKLEKLCEALLIDPETQKELMKLSGYI